MHVIGKKESYTTFTIQLFDQTEIQALRSAMVNLRTNMAYRQEFRDVYSALYRKLYTPDKVEE